MEEEEEEKEERVMLFLSRLLYHIPQLCLVLDLPILMVEAGAEPISGDVPVTNVLRYSKLLRLIV